MRCAALFLLAWSALGTAAEAADLGVALRGLRNTRGLVHVCLTRDSAHFPDCAGDPQAIRRTLPAAQAAQFDIANVAPGNYALSVIHDENGNGRLDTFMAIPREGFGFSRNPGIRMGPPRFAETVFAIAGARATMIVTMKYML
ncbi:MAG TPA: DUF2141 domain-containing protein [Allosphingosinicella sp.]